MDTTTPCKGHVATARSGKLYSFSAGLDKQREVSCRYANSAHSPTYVLMG